jgi:uncharacterized protein (TIGR02118 family)
MFKVVALIKRNPKLSREEFIHYWKTVHVPLVRPMLPGLVKYIGSFPVSDEAAPGSGTSAATFDGMVELGFETREALEAAMSSPLFMSEERQRSSAALMDLVRTQTLVVEENVVPL